MPGQEAYVTLVTNDNYALGALALGRSLRDTLTTRRLSLLITDEVSYPMRERLGVLWDELTVVDLLDSGDEDRLALLTRPELGVTFSKLHAWKLTQYSKCVFLDADTLVLENVDELFDREELSAAPDIGWPDCFNSGVFVFEPSVDTYTNLLEMAKQTGSFDGGDQGLLNLYWPDWATKDIKFHLPFIYNMVPNAAYGYAPAFLRFGRNAKIIHFIGAVKPWHHQYVPGVDAVVLTPGSYSSTSAAYDFIKLWWQAYNRTCEGAEHSTTHEATVVGELYYPSDKSQDQHDIEQGNIDYTGKDSFENLVLSALDQRLEDSERGD
ncbi:Glycogenin-1 [Geodia barretti]|uniref:glycogenin glucosyltransferase n=1 Tax=Geodia barretti TaxID=519541 RepID=A0AA35W4E2_GEOBA|nr:Glycogenin-1 [Geodia barretti]